VHERLTHVASLREGATVGSTNSDDYLMIDTTFADMGDEFASQVMNLVAPDDARALPGSSGGE